jgi:DNA-binding response OmpR family regulator
MRGRSVVQDRATRAKILVVHRDDALLRVIREFLLVQGYGVVCAPGVDEARRIVSCRAGPDVVLVDEETVGDDGCERLRGVADAAPRVMLTWKPRSMHPPGVIALVNHSARATSAR